MVKSLAIILEQKLTIGTIESFTGGGLSQAFLSHPGASSWFFQGLVLYQLQAKAGWLNTTEKDLSLLDPVSEDMIALLLKRACFLHPGVIWLATTGNAGPERHGQQPVGQMFIGISDGQQTMIQGHHLQGNRQVIQQGGIQFALSLLEEFLSTYYKLPTK